MDCQVQDLTEVMLDIAPVNTVSDIALQAVTEDIEPRVNTSANLVSTEMAGNESHDNAANVLPPEMLVNDFPDKTKANDILPSDITMHATSVNADTNTVFLQPLEFKEGVVQKVCDLCGASFKKKPYLNRHLKKVHGGKKVANPLNVTVSFDEAKPHDTIEVDHTDLEEEGTTNEKYQVDNTHTDVDFKSTISDTQQDIMMDTSGSMGNPNDGITISCNSTVETKRAKCAICQSSFKKSLYLRRHIKVKHPHLKQQESNVEGTSIYPVDAKLNEKDADGLVINKHFCEICPRSFKRRAYLRQHMKKFHMAQRSKDGNSCNQTLNKAMPGKVAEKHDTHSDEKQAKRAVSSNILPLNLGTNEEIATGPTSNENLVINTSACVKEEFPISLDTNKEQGTCSAQEGNIFQLGVQFDCVDGAIHRNIEIIDNGNTKVSGKSAVIEGCTLGDMFVQVKDIIGDVTLKPENITFELKGKGMTLKVKY